MVWGGVSDCGKKTPLVMIPEGVKVNKDVYINMLSSEVVPWVNAQNWEHGFCLQADDAPAHTANKTQEWCKEKY